MSELNLITIGYAKQALDSNSRESERFLSYAKELGQYHAIIFTRQCDQLPGYHQAGNLQVYGTNTKTRLGMLWRAYKLGRKIINDNPNLDWFVSSQDPFETGLVAWFLTLKANAHLNVQIHGDFFGSPFWVKESWLNRLRRWFGLILLKRAYTVRVVADRIKKSIVTLGVKASKVKMLPVYVDLAPFLKVGYDRIYNRQKTYTFIYVGRLAPEKNLGSLLQAFSSLNKEHKNTRLHLVGDGPKRSDLQAQIQNLNIGNATELTAWTKDVPAEFKNANIFVLPSFHEGYGLVISEAMASGLPVITTDVGCVGECLVNGEQGVVTSHDPQSIHDAMLLYLRSPDLIAKHGALAVKKAQAIQESQQTYVKQWKDSFRR